MRPLFDTKWERIFAVALVVGWAALFLPNLRTNPNWYADEGEWMEKCWTFIHGTPRVGPIVNDFVFPYSYPPLYMLVTGSLLRAFGDDIVVARAVGDRVPPGAAESSWRDSEAAGGSAQGDVYAQ